MIYVFISFFGFQRIIKSFLHTSNKKISRQKHIDKSKTMDTLTESNISNSPIKKTFFNHVFSTTEESKAEIMNVIQYALIGIIPIVLLNKLIQRFIPEANSEKSSLELLAEILIQLIIMFCGIIIIHRIITFVPTYSEFKYDSFTLTNGILAFLILVLSIQTKIGIKVNILFDRIMDLINGTSSAENETQQKKKVRVSQPVTTSRHMPSQGDNMDSFQPDMFPPAPMVTSNKPSVPSATPSMGGGGGGEYYGPMAANSVLGGAFGSSF